ncbi:ROK family transcriptional regulator [Spirochaeta cellobiosiphila]|uniref:ROK family transcriptional regulator n=1 Tax=Spirochaeta cellobiosiphila TaxID=504483 RepID=UPI0004041EA7|nr:ROK family transcriptional regulator [Spirochaeta cellobiosiphila]
MVAGNQAFQKQANVALVLKLIREYNLISRIELSRQLGLKKSTVTNIINELLEYNLVEIRKEGDASQAGGRKPVYLGINPRMGSILGLELEVGYFRAILCDITGQELWSKVEEIPKGPIDNVFFRVLKRLDSDIKAQRIPLLAIGVGVSAIVNHKEGLLSYSHSWKLEEFDFYNKISMKMDIPVFFENDSNCCAWGELWKKHGIYQNFLYVLSRFHYHNLRTTDIPGVGLGMVVRGQVVYGSSYRAGDFCTNDWDVPGTEYLDMTRDELLSIGQDKDLMIKFMTNIFRKLSVTFSLFNPDSIILGGDIQYYRELLPQVMDNLKGDSWFQDGSNQSKIHFNRSGDKEIPYGAAAFVLDNLYSLPQVGNKTGKVSFDWDHVLMRTH